MNRLVALRTEGVDRNYRLSVLAGICGPVALRTEGVDRNNNKKKDASGRECRPPHGGRG